MLFLLFLTPFDHFWPLLTPFDLFLTCFWPVFDLFLTCFWPPSGSWILFSPLFTSWDFPCYCLLRSGYYFILLLSIGDFYWHACSLVLIFLHSYLIAIVIVLGSSRVYAEDLISGVGSWRTLRFWFGDLFLMILEVFLMILEVFLASSRILDLFLHLLGLPLLLVPSIWVLFSTTFWVYYHSLNI